MFHDQLVESFDGVTGRPLDSVLSPKRGRAERGATGRDDTYIDNRTRIAIIAPTDRLRGTGIDRRPYGTGTNRRLDNRSHVCNDGIAHNRNRPAG